jgi:hypothetical protein
LDTQARKFPALFAPEGLCSGLDLPEQVVHRLLLTTGWCAALPKRGSSKKPPFCGTDSWR